MQQKLRKPTNLTELSSGCVARLNIKLIIKNLALEQLFIHNPCTAPSYAWWYCKKFEVDIENIH